MSKTKSSSDMTSGDDWWIVRGNWLPNGVKIAGPFTTREDALRARTAVEAFAGGETFYVDSTKSVILV